MIAILEAFSNSVSALPVVGSSAPLGSAAPASGGFAARLAVAQGVSATSQPAASEAETSEESATESTGTPGSLNVRMPAGNTPAKKLPGGNPPLAGNAWAGPNTVVPGFVPAMVNQISLPVQPNVTQTGAPAQSPISNGAGGIVQPAGVQQHGSQISAYQAVAKDASLSYSVDYPGPRSVLIPGESGGQANGQVNSPVNVAQLPVLSAATGETVSGGLAGSRSDPGNPWNGELSFAPRAENTQPSIPSTSRANSLASSSAQPASGTVVRGVMPGSVGGDSQAEPAPGTNTLLAENTLQSALSAANAEPLSTAGWQEVVPAALPSGSAVDGIGNGTGEPFTQAAQAVPTLLASASSAAVKVQSSAAADIPISQANSSSAIVPAEDQIDPAAQMGAGNGLSGILSGAGPAAREANPAAQWAPVRTVVRSAAAKVTAALASPGMRTSGATAPASTLAASPSAATEASNGSAASQTPFSIFFSSPGPGTESAASTLPKMILPATSSSLRDIHSGAADPSSVSAPSGGVTHGGVSTNNAAQNAALPNSADAPSGPSGSLSTTQTLHADPTAATAAVAAPPAAAAASPVAPGSAGSTLPLVQPAASSVDTLPKSGTAAGAAGNPATPTPPAAEPTPAMVAGPVQMAQMVSRVGQAEMRIGVNTSAFGSVEVRTVVHANDVGLTIGSEKGDLRGLLNNEMPAITNGLQQQNLRLSSVNFTQGFSSSGNGPGGGDSQQRSFVPAAVASGSVASEGAGDDFIDTLPPSVFSGGTSGLSILA